ncbi:hypothetical protein COLO4_02983 [Corchorus olitorius]|uniref:Uncharacterized protein n=1 Tax=Corchorus olitorius TaxID=93759 RepID=A0A1R3KZS1_9ROSI|nr:hypothetical protein COLO4_02983 [Corchorus olitorius]
MEVKEKKIAREKTEVDCRTVDSVNWPCPCPDDLASNPLPNPSSKLEPQANK